MCPARRGDAAGRHAADHAGAAGSQGQAPASSRLLHLHHGELPVQAIKGPTSVGPFGSQRDLLVTIQAEPLKSIA